MSAVTVTLTVSDGGGTQTKIVLDDPEKQVSFFDDLLLAYDKSEASLLERIEKAAHDGDAKNEIPGWARQIDTVRARRGKIYKAVRQVEAVA